MSDAVKCDSCGAYADIKARSHFDYLRGGHDPFYASPVPTGWVKLRAFTWPDHEQSGSFAVDGEVCSWACAVALIAKVNPAKTVAPDYDRPFTRRPA